MEERGFLLNGGGGSDAVVDQHFIIPRRLREFRDLISICDFAAARILCLKLLRKGVRRDVLISEMNAGAEYLFTMAKYHKRVLAHVRSLEVDELTRIAELIEGKPIISSRLKRTTYTSSTED